jgi:hypothetical protein
LTDHPHEQHRPEIGRAPSEAAEHAPTSMGQLYPLGDILGAMEDRAAAESAAAELRNIGVPEGDVDLLDGEWFLSAVKELRERRNPLQRFLAVLASDEGEATQQLAQAAASGHTIMVVHATDLDTCNDAIRVLREHGAHSMLHFGKLVMTEL